MLTTAIATLQSTGNAIDSQLLSSRYSLIGHCTVHLYLFATFRSSRQSGSSALRSVFVPKVHCLIIINATRLSISMQVHTNMNVYEAG